MQALENKHYFVSSLGEIVKIIHWFEWNPGRHYTPNGQRITAIVTRDRCYFRDHARGIDASFTCDGETLRRSDPLTQQDVVLAVYDHGPAAGLRYESSSVLDELLEALDATKE